VVKKKEPRLHEMCLVQLKGHQEAVTSVNFDPKGYYLASASTDRTIRLWSMSDVLEKRFQIYNMKFDHASAIEWSSNGKALVVANYNERNIDIFQVNTKSDDKNKVLKLHSSTSRENGHKQMIKKLRTYKNLIISISDETTSFVWSSNDGSLITQLTTKQMKNFDVAVSYDKDYVAVSTALGVRIWRIVDSKIVEPHLTNISSTNNLNSITFVDQGNGLATASSDKTWRIYDLDGNYDKGFQPRLEVEVQHPEGLSYDKIAASHDSTLVAVTSGSVLYIYTRDGDLVHTLEDAHYGSIGSLSWFPQSYLLATSDESSVVQVFDFN